MTHQAREYYKGRWQIRAFCKCGFDAGSHLGGSIWFATQEYPVCPDCGEYSRGSFENKTVRWVCTGWFGKGHFESQDAAALRARAPQTGGGK